MNNSRILILLASSRKESNTAKFANACFEDLNATYLDLLDYKINHYAYGHEGDDDFLAVVKAMQEHDVIAFATPIYWYAMSGHLKVFFDRLTELITRQKPMGRSLAGKKTMVVATGTDNELPEGFEVSFRRTSEYFDIVYLGCAYMKVEREPFDVGQEAKSSCKELIQRLSL
jgi:multimeric flavodoxin WrbA